MKSDIKITFDRALIALSIIIISLSASRSLSKIGDFNTKTWKHPTLTQDDIIYSSTRNTAPIVNEEYKVIFFQVAKAASSEWIRFFARLAGLKSWCKGDIHSKDKNGLIYLNDIPIERAQEMMLDPEWTKAMFVRNPKPRLLSAFLDKAVVHARHFKDSTCDSYQKKGGDYMYCREHNEDFGFFLKNITTINWENVHWRPIYTRVDEKWWPYINHVRNMENLSEDAEQFLRSIKSVNDGVSAWDRIGKKGWSANERNCKKEGKKAFLEKKDTQHHTDASAKMRNYYTPELEKYVEERFAKDFNNPYFHFSPLKLYPETQDHA